MGVLEVDNYLELVDHILKVSSLLLQSRVSDKYCIHLCSRDGSVEAAAIHDLILIHGDYYHIELTSLSDSRRVLSS